MANLYVWWSLTGNPPAPWQKLSIYDGKYFRCTSAIADALKTGGNSQHNHTLGTGHTIGTTNDLASFATSGSLNIGKSLGTGHNHAIGTIAISPADNTPSYYDLSLISINLDEFMLNQRKLPNGAVVASSTSLSSTGMTRFSAADNKLVKLGPTPGINSSVTIHNHSFSGALSEYQCSNTAFCLSGGTQVSSPTSKHSHGMSTLKLLDQDILPARIQTRAYKVTTSPYLLSIPVGTVLFTDGSYSSYSSYFESLPDWDGRFIELKNANPNQIGSNVHNHGSSISGATDAMTGSIISATGGGAGQGLLASHTHNVTIYINASDVDHTPPYVNFIPVKVIREINALAVKTQYYNIDAILKRTRSNSYQIGTTLLLPGTKAYKVDALLKKKSLFTYSIKPQLASRKRQQYGNDSLIKRVGTLLPYRMGMEPIFYRGKRYSLGLTLIYRDIIPRKSVIDTLLDSWIDQYNKILQKMEAVHGELKLDDATGYDLDRRWGRTFHLPRDPGEDDTSYRERIRAHTVAVMGCGTKDTIRKMLNAVTQGSSTKIDIYPGIIRISFTDPNQEKIAEGRKTAINKILNSAVAAGVKWNIYYTFCRYDIDLLLKKQGILSGYNMDILANKTFYKDFHINTSVQLRGYGAYVMDSLFKKKCSYSIYNDMLLRKVEYREYVIDSYLRRRMLFSYETDALLKRTCRTSLNMRHSILKHALKDYSVNLRMQVVNINFYIMELMIISRPSYTYNMGVTINA